MLRGVSVLKKMLHSGQIWDQKGAIIKLVQKKYLSNLFLVGLLMRMEQWEVSHQKRKTHKKMELR